GAGAGRAGQGLGPPDRPGRSGHGRRVGGGMKTLVLAVAGLTVLASGLAAQRRPRGTALADGAIVRYGTKLGGAVAGSFGGPTFGVQAGLSLAKFTLSAQYLEGRLQPRSGSPDTVSRDLVEARLLLALRPVPWLSLGAGPHIRR